MSFWLSAIPVQNCSLNLKIVRFSKKRAKSRLPQQSKPTPAPTIPARIARSPHSPLGIVATGREVVQEESHTYSEMTRCVRLFNNTLFPCGSLTHGEVAVSGDAVRVAENIRLFPRSASSNFHRLPGTGMGADCLICDRQALRWRNVMASLSRPEQPCSALPGTTLSRRSAPSTM